MRVSVVTVGINQWKEFTSPLIKSIERYQSDVDVVLVDNGSKEPYPSIAPYTLVRSDAVLSYAQAINLGLEETDVFDWVIIINNDVLCISPFRKKLEELDPNILYGNQLNHASKFGHYVEGWLFAIPFNVMSKVGLFDEKFQYAAFEDVDYSFRAKQAGLKVVKTELPFKHLKAATRFTRPEYREVYLENRRYLHKKHGFR